MLGGEHYIIRKLQLYSCLKSCRKPWVPFYFCIPSAIAYFYWDNLLVERILLIFFPWTNTRWYMQSSFLLLVYHLSETPFLLKRGGNTSMGRMLFRPLFVQCSALSSVGRLPHLFWLGERRVAMGAWWLRIRKMHVCDSFLLAATKDNNHKWRARLLKLKWWCYLIPVNNGLTMYPSCYIFLLFSCFLSVK